MAGVDGLGTYEQLIEALKIFLVYIPEFKEYQELSAEHDVLYAGPEPSVVSAEHLALLEEYGWHADQENLCFYKFV